MTTNPNEIEAAVGRIREMIQDPATISFGQHSTRRINEDLHILASAASARGVADGDVVEAVAEAIRDAGHIFADDRNYERIARVAVRVALSAAPSSPAATPEVKRLECAGISEENGQGMGVPKECTHGFHGEGPCGGTIALRPAYLTLGPTYQCERCGTSYGSPDQ